MDGQNPRSTPVGTAGALSQRRPHWCRTLSTVSQQDVKRVLNSTKMTNRSNSGTFSTRKLLCLLSGTRASRARFPKRWSTLCSWHSFGSRSFFARSSQWFAHRTALGINCSLFVFVCRCCPFIPQIACCLRIVWAGYRRTPLVLRLCSDSQRSTTQLLKRKSTAARHNLLLFS